MNKVYVGDVGTEIVLDCGMDISAATSRQIVARKPSGRVVTWTAQPEGATAIKYVTQAGDLNVAGVWQLQAKIELADWSGLGNASSLTVLPPV